ncbi:MAG: type II toxin-antitoxin system PemK/MazF family toxin [Deltaproteobacteria bacterium]|nr:type II toxin-antitoxin system PemK/MazF family toxin [Deltaproteobacteria bacterium]
MIKFKRGDVVLVEVVFSEGSGTKKRPALIISTDDYNESRQEVIIVAITSNVKRILYGDTKIQNWKDTGLIYPSLVTGIIQTIKSNMITYKLGTLSKQDLKRVQANLKKTLKL